MIKCQLSGTVKDVTLEEIQGKRELSSICKMEAYTSKIEDKTKQRNYMATITRQLKVSFAPVLDTTLFVLKQTGVRL